MNIDMSVEEAKKILNEDLKIIEINELEKCKEEGYCTSAYKKCIEERVIAIETILKELDNKSEKITKATEVAKKIEDDYFGRKCIYTDKLLTILKGDQLCIQKELKQKRSYTINLN